MAAGTVQVSFQIGDTRVDSISDFTLFEQFEALNYLPTSGSDDGGTEVHITFSVADVPGADWNALSSHVPSWTLRMLLNICCLTVGSQADTWLGSC